MNEDRRAVLAVALLVLFCGTAATAALAARFFPKERWTVFHVTGVAQDTWSTWYSAQPWPTRYRFKCSKGAVVINAGNTSNIQQGARVTAWDAEPNEDVLDRAIASGRAELNAGFTLPAGQSRIVNLYRPSLCNAATQDFVFAVVYN
jgi:hypothetical protein